MSQASTYRSYAAMPPPIYYQPSQPDIPSLPQFIGQASNQQQSLSPPPPSRNNSNDHHSVISDITTQHNNNRPGSQGGGSIMGGRNDQASMQSCNQNGRWIGKIRSRWNIGSSTTRHIEPIENTAANNKANTNANTCCLGTNFIPIAIANCTAVITIHF